MKLSLARHLLPAITLLLPALALAQTPLVSAPENEAGRSLYQDNCASCHEQPELTKSPPVDTLRRMGPRAVSYALTNGKMIAQAANLSPEQIDALVSYLAGTAAVDNSWIAANTCPAARLAV
ncbi:MAG: cytochrome c, partial [Pseudomonadales bacterium]|nr:cytochrome c [Pseudomonadales bacterium]